MGWKRIVFVSVLCGGILFAPLAAHAWGPSAHMYVAMRITGTTYMDVLYGAMCPDLFGFGSTSEIKSRIQHLTHFEFHRLSPSTFALGLATHNGTWGADYYSHAYYDPHAPDTYLTARMRQVSQEFGFTIYRAEDLIEATVDYLIRRDQGPEWGMLVKAVADGTGSDAGEALVDAFALPLSQRVAGLTEDAAATQIRAMFQQHLLLTRTYGDQLALHDDAFIRSTLVSGMAVYFGVDEPTANLYFTRAEDLCSDYQDELDRIGTVLAEKLRETPYHLPLLPMGMATLALALGMAALWLQRRRLRGGDR